MTLNPQEKLERVFEALDDMGERIYRAYVNGNKSDARIMFRQCPPNRRGYLAYTILGRHSVTGDNPRIIDFDDFFKSVTE